MGTHTKKTAQPARPLHLKTAILRSGKPQYQVAREAGLTETRLSRIAMGRIEPEAAERKSLAAVLGVDADVLFEKEGTS